MPLLRLQIVRFVDESQPGWVAGVFTDAEGQEHTIIDKVPVIATSELWTDSQYPQPGFAACEVLQRLTDGRNEAVVRIDIDKPWRLTSTDGQSVFLVLASQLSESISP